MFKLIKFIISSILLLSFGYFLFFVPLGPKTLYQHLHTISNTNEAKDLSDGIKQKADDVTTNVVETVPQLKSVDNKVRAVKTAVSSREALKVSSGAKGTSVQPKPSTSDKSMVNRGPRGEMQKSDIPPKDRTQLQQLLRSRR